MLQDMFLKAANYNADISKDVYSADRKMMELFVLALRERQAKRDFSIPKGNGLQDA